jgi:hypothetical protein
MTEKETTLKDVADLLKQHSEMLAGIKSLLIGDEQACEKDVIVTSRIPYRGRHSIASMLDRILSNTQTLIENTKHLRQP